MIAAPGDRYNSEILTAQNAPEIEVYAEIPAKEILMTPKGETVVDFGQNMAGTVRVEISAKEGEEICFEHGETLDRTETLPMHSRIRPGRRKMSVSVREERPKYLNRSLLTMDFVM